MYFRAIKIGKWWAIQYRKWWFPFYTTMGYVDSYIKADYQLQKYREEYN